MAINAYELLKKRLEARGGNQEGRMKQGKLETLLKALQYSEQAETLIKDGVEYRAILNKNKQKMDYDDKNISIPFEAGFKVGDIFHWVEDDTDWIVYLKEGQDAYFTGVCRKAIYDIRWKDDYGVYHNIKAAVRGPVETKIVGEFKSGISFDKPNYTLNCIIPNTEETQKLKRYSKVSINQEVWEVVVTNDISEPGIIEVQLLEDYRNQIEDEELVKPGTGESCEFVPSENVKINTSLDSVDTLEINEPYKLWASVEKNGVYDKEMSMQAEFSTSSGAVIDKSGMLTPVEVGVLEVELNIPRLCYKKAFAIDITDAEMPSISKYEIVGDDSVKSFGSNTYEIAFFMDGLQAEGELGTWVVEQNKTLFSASDISSNSITFNWKIGSHGSVKLQYAINNNVVAEKIIKVDSLI